MTFKLGPVFIVGVNGSGTTMLSEALGRHPSLYMLPDESRVLPYFAHRYPEAKLREPSARRALANELGASRAFWRANGERPLVFDGAEDFPPTFEAVVGAVYAKLAAVQGKSRWGDKSPMYLQHIRLLAEHFPDARFVHIHRDGRDAAQSCHRRWKQEPRRTMHRWKHATRLGHDQGLALGSERYMEVCYETLTADVEQEMRRVSDFLALPFCNEVLKTSCQTMDETTRAEAQGRIVPNSGRWMTYFTAEQIKTLERIGGQTLHDHGYKVAMRGDEDPPHAQLLLWKARDRLRQVVDHLFRYGLKSVFALKRRVQDALRQDKVNKY